MWQDVTIQDNFLKHVPNKFDFYRSTMNGPHIKLHPHTAITEYETRDGPRSKEISTIKDLLRK